MDSPHKRRVMRKMFPCHDIILDLDWKALGPYEYEDRLSSYDISIIKIRLVLSLWCASLYWRDGIFILRRPRGLHRPSDIKFGKHYTLTCISAQTFTVSLSDIKTHFKQVTWDKFLVQSWRIMGLCTKSALVLLLALFLQYLPSLLRTPLPPHVTGFVAEGWEGVEEVFR